MKWTFLGFISTVTLFGSVAIIPQETEHYAHWTYEGKDGQTSGQRLTLLIPSARWATISRR
jgi:hypothetical protein